MKPLSTNAFGPIAKSTQQRRRTLAALCAGAFAPLTSFAQQPPKVWRIGYLSPATEASQVPRVAPFRAGLRELGYVEGKNLIIEFRWADGKPERLPELAAELVRLKVDLIVTHGADGGTVAKQATGTIPIVVAVSGDFVAQGLANSLAKPGMNVTGGSIFGPELAAKGLELLKEAIPGLPRIAVLLPSSGPGTKTNMDAITAAALRLKVEVLRFEAVDLKDIENAFAAMVKQRAGGLLVPSHAVLNFKAKTITALALKHHLPSSGIVDFAEAGGMLGYGVSFPALYRHAAVSVDKIFKGTKPGDIPIEQPTTFEFVVNLKTAKALGIKVPGTILLQATRVIE